MVQIDFDIAYDETDVIEVSAQELSKQEWIVGGLHREMEMSDSVCFVFVMDIYEEEFSDMGGERVMERDGHRISIKQGNQFYHEETKHGVGYPSYLTNLGGDRLFVTTATYGDGGDLELWVFRFNKADA